MTDETNKPLRPEPSFLDEGWEMDDGTGPDLGPSGWGTKLGFGLHVQDKDGALELFYCDRLGKSPSLFLRLEEFEALLAFAKIFKPESIQYSPAREKTVECESAAFHADEFEHAGPVFAVRRDGNSMATAIDCQGVTVLHLNPGTERNEICAELIAEALCSLDRSRIEKILQAVGAYRFLDRLKGKQA